MIFQAKKKSGYLPRRKKMKKTALQPHGFGERSRWCCWICSCLRCCVYFFLTFCKFTVSIWFCPYCQRWFAAYLSHHWYSTTIPNVVTNKARVPKGRGLWPAIWMLPSKGALLFTWKPLWFWSLPLGALRKIKQTTYGFLQGLVFCKERALVCRNLKCTFYVASAGNVRLLPIVFSSVWKKVSRPQK